MTFSDDLEAARARAGSARFRIKRLGLDVAPDWPWRLHDHERPYVFGYARTHRAAVLLIEAILNGNSIVLDDNDHVLAYRPGAADPVNPTRFVVKVESDGRASYGHLVPPLAAQQFRIVDLRPHMHTYDNAVRDLSRRYETALGAALLPDCNCGSVDKYGDDIGEHSPRCPYHLAVLRLAPLVDRQTLDRVCKASLERMARDA